MHEAGLAAAVADALRRAPLDGARVRLLVSGGHGDPDDFDGALRLHLIAAAPELEAVPLEIVHLPAPRLCIGCGREYAAVAEDAPCPSCGASGLAVPSPERLEIELLRPDVPRP
jgi:hypothetical protein